MKLQPLLDNLKDVEVAKGRYEVQLEIPKTSTLTDSDIEKIMALSTWKSDPNRESRGYEGTRSVLLEREKPIKRGPINLKGLQISGIGYKKFEFSRGLMTTLDDDFFYPPCKENFMSYTKGTYMSTSHAEGRKITTVRPVYRALGTYTQPELRTKLRKTMEASTLQLEKMVTPNVEAYGRYLDSELQNDDGNFGFIVVPIPDTDKQRAVAEAFKTFSEKTKKETDSRKKAMVFYFETAPYVTALAQSLRELHDKPRLVHLQPHLSNFYLVGNTPYVLDWATMRRLGNNREENIINRTIDLKKPTDNYNTIFSGIFPNAPEEVKTYMEDTIKEIAMEIYSGNIKKEIKLSSLVQKYYNVLGGEATEFDLMAQWMKDLGLEGFPQKTFERKIGRNEPCPCGSGIKFKRCCGKH